MVRKDCIKVLVRTRPTASFSQDQILVDSVKNTIKIQRRDGGVGEDQAPTDNKRDTWNFQFNKVLHNAGQDTMYDESTEPIVSACVEGVNGTVMAYGQTGAGKTFTMTGDTQNYKQRGIIPRAVAQLFQEIADKPQQEFQVYCSYMEIYNEKIYDLLDDATTSKGGKTRSERDYQITEDKRTHSMQVRGLTLESVANEEDALNLLFRGEQNRIVAEHQLNKQSNRSHSIFTLHIEQKSRLRSEDVLRSKLNLVDLAGSERLKKAIGERMDDTLKKESRYINKSLTYLEQVVVALTSNSRSHIPYRQTKLTNVLKDSLGGNCNTALIACIWGESKHIEESISTLKLAQRMMRVENHALSNVQMDASLLLKRYERQIRELKQELMMHDALANRSGVSYEEYTPEECRDIAKKVRAYVDAPPEAEEDAAINVQSVRQVQECFKQFKILILNVESQVEEKLRGQFLLQAKPQQMGDQKTSQGGNSGAGSNETTSGSDQQFVGDEEDGKGFALGNAPPNARPKDIETPPKLDNELEGKTGDELDSNEHPTNLPESADAAVSALAVDRSTLALLDVPADKEQAFRLFMQTEGRLLNSKVHALTQEIHEYSQEMQVCRRKLKATQADMDQKQSQVDSIRSEEKSDESKTKEMGEEAIIDEEEYILLREIKSLRKEFRLLREKYDEAKSKRDLCVSNRDEGHREMLEQYQLWYDEAQRTREEKAGNEDVLDDGEKFDMLEIERVHSEDPESVAFFKATKAQRDRSRRRQRPVQQSRRVQQR